MSISLQRLVDKGSNVGLTAGEIHDAIVLLVRESGRLRLICLFFDSLSSLISL